MVKRRKYTRETDRNIVADHGTAKRGRGECLRGHRRSKQVCTIARITELENRLVALCGHRRRRRDLERE